MPQGALPYKIEEEKSPCGATALAGLPLYLDLAKVLGLGELLATHLRARESKQGWSDAEIAMSLVLLQLAGGDCVDDLRVLESDDGFCRILQRVEADLLGLPRKERRRIQLSWRREKTRAVPSPSTVFRFLDVFEVDEATRIPGKAWIAPVPESLSSLRRVNAEFIAAVNARAQEKVATLDVDATLQEVFKENALHCYKGFKAYQPLNVYWSELDLVLHSEFRQGNVPAGFDILRVFQESLEYQPAEVEKVQFRSDSAAYVTDLLLYLAAGKHPRFGVIDFTVSVDITPEFRAAAAKVKNWVPILRPARKNGRIEMEATGHEYAEVCYTSSALSYSKNNPDLRFIAIRRLLSDSDQARLKGVEQLELPFPVAEMQSNWYKLTAIVTNRLHDPAEELIRWHRARCGKSEEAHAVMKGDLAGGRLPSGRFGQNAAWWAIMVLAYNLNSSMKRLVLGKEYENARLKGLRFNLICLAGRVIEHGRQLIIRLSQGHPAIGMLVEARRRCLMLAGAT